MARKDWYYMHLPKLLIKRLDQFLQTSRAKNTGMTNKPELLRHVINKSRFGGKTSWLDIHSNRLQANGVSNS